MKKKTLKEAGKVVAVSTAFLIGFVLLFVIPDDRHETREWILLLIESKILAAACLCIGRRLYKRWGNSGWIKRYSKWIEEVDRMPNPLNQGDKE